MDNKYLCSIIMAFIFALSALLFAYSQNQSASATDMIIESVIDYQTSIIQSESILLQKVTENSLISLGEIELENRNYACLGLSLFSQNLKAINTEENISQENISDMSSYLKNECIPENKTYILDTVNFTNLNNLNLISPLENYLSKIKKINDLRSSAKFWQTISIILFILGIIIFIISLSFINQKA